jgi:uncharacterized protein YggE
MILLPPHGRYVTAERQRNDMKNSLRIRPLAIGLMMGAMASCFLPLAASAAEVPLRQISVTGEAERNFSPDKADVMVVVEGRGKTLAEAKKQHDELLAGLHQVTAKFEIAKNNVKTLSDSISPQYDYVSDDKGNGRQVLRGYAAEHRLQITLETLDKVGDFINAVVAKKIDRIEGIRYGLKDSKAAELDVTISAVKNAKTKAQQIVGALDATLGEVLSVNTGGTGYAPQPMPMMMMAKSADMTMGSAPEAAPTVPTGDVSIHQQVTVQFAIGD